MDGSNPQIVEVSLTLSEIMYGAYAGIGRRVSAIKKGRPAYYGLDDSANWQIDVEGALAEKAVAKYLNLYWTDSVGVAAPGDIGRLEVRSTKYKDGHLIIHKSDPDDSYFFLVTGIEGKYRLPGYIRAVDGKLDAFWECKKKGRDFQYYVPQNQLIPVEQFNA